MKSLRNPGQIKADDDKNGTETVERADVLDAKGTAVKLSVKIDVEGLAVIHVLGLCGAIVSVLVPIDAVYTWTLFSHCVMKAAKIPVPITPSISKSIPEKNNGVGSPAHAKLDQLRVFGDPAPIQT